MAATLPEWPGAVHEVLRSWHSGGLAEMPWAGLALVRQRLAEQPLPNLERAIKEVVLDALDRLEQHASRDEARILRLRFLDGLPATAVAHRLNSSVNVIYKIQRVAIEELATILQQAEQQANATRTARVLARLEIQSPPRLFGVADKLAELLVPLTATDSPWLIAVVGIGGIGKTSLADAAVRSLAASPAVADIAWVSARQERFTFWGGLQKGAEGAPALTTERLVDRLVEQLEFHDLAQLPLAQKQAGLRDRLRSQPYLVVVDNLETAADYRALIPNLQSLVNPTRFLLTSRHSLHAHPGVHCLDLDELSATDSLALLRHEAGERGLASVAAASDEALLQVYGVAGGNPLALKLLLGQMHTLSLPKVVADLRQARGQSADDLYRFVYWSSWNLLNDEARRVLAIMPLVAESGGGLEQIATLSTLADEPLTAALQQLVALSLVNVRGAIADRRYSIHRLTETFLLHEVLKWQTTS